MKKLLSLFIAMNLVGFSTSSHAADLLQIYQQAKETNPELLKAQADRNSVVERINETRSSLLPQLGLSAGVDYGKGFRSPQVSETHGASAGLKLTQTLFDMAKWNRLNQSEKNAGIADISYQAAQQKLILDTAQAYFDVLSNIDTLTYSEAQKTSLYRQLDQTTQRFNVGLAAITDVQNSRAQYDSILAKEVSNRNNLENALEKLRMITGVYYPQLAALNIDQFKTKQPEPANTVLKEAENRNLNLLSARLTQDLKREQIKESQTGYMPTLNLTAGTSVRNGHSRGAEYSNTYSGSNSVDLSLSLPLFNGGATYSQVEQAKYNFVAASQELENTYRKVIQEVHSSSNNIAAAISSIEANKQAVLSAQSSLDSMEAGYQVGTRTIVDVLDSTTKLYEAKQNLSKARYDYLLAQLSIQQARGTLNENDLVALNNMLSAQISTSASSIIKEMKTPSIR
ncbi:outer membrane channel; tolerance to colicin E1, segregation of daughter chromosomes, role in organic solvent tolerance [Xenorhabdus nematophila ATCC 19061]|uniref:Outer membrane protein TolC n=1 Tax=Xenorhabdus nematophila (strain ATCC 19061 / DSM 3370 / CCUG 14189 / LMG 1036 / NCIMB 9965 / AN6) TaxID=406817 RepID=D3VCR7_XENNA|nr:outer membrane channel protein TolC [Xenorhabdus nematophila]CBJ92102.1 outer membrane channel; tolerance to colicin E1, segregation of daughter chromosomes, role in organic solvent tolerance [Xenorhabdus nematophila ATCC 19061]CEE91406.1 outer membrane channel; tolerance to colicin E1, segregation of daughter chromosomes, role in organic solvent tolerance [Xenorhabdus nematophila str. Anatoliense]CEK24917.1 outer membrane channel; tolerance to colicin E1, segregation of daughter chromosomes,